MPAHVDRLVSLDKAENNWVMAAVGGGCVSAVMYDLHVDVDSISLAKQVSQSVMRSSTQSLSQPVPSSYSGCGSEKPGGGAELPNGSVRDVGLMNLC